MDFSEKYIRLRSVPPFDKIEQNDAAVIANVCLDYAFSPSAHVARKGDLATHLFIVYEGAIADSAGKKFSLFDASVLLDYSDYTADAFADAELGAKCLVLTRENFFSAVRNCPKLLLELAEMARCSKEGGR